jgi:hypothetical protein
MRLRTPLRTVGVTTLRWQRWRAKNVGLVSLRCHGICEGCGKASKLDAHHVIGRADEPFSSMVELLAGLCRPCHMSVTGTIGGGINGALRIRLSRDAYNRLTARYGVLGGTLAMQIKALKKGFEYSAAGNCIESAGDHAASHR